MMKKRSPYDKALGEIVKPYGFFKCRQVYIRLCNNGVIQSANYAYEPHSTTGDKYCLYVNCGSIYEHHLFGLFGNVIEMTESILVTDYYAWTNGLSKSELWNWDEWKQLEIFASETLPVLLETTTQQAVFQLHSKIDFLEFNKYPYHLSNDLYLALYLGMYDEAKRMIKATIDYRREVWERNYTFARMIKPNEDVEKLMSRNERSLEPLLTIKQHLMNDDEDSIARILLEQKKRNITTLASILPKHSKYRLTEFEKGIPE